LRKLAHELGFPPSFAASLSDVLREKHQNVSLKTENRIRIAIGLNPIEAYEVPPCPDCGSVHTGRCYGKAKGGPVEVRVIRIGNSSHRTRKTVSLSVETFEMLNAERLRLHLTWEEFLRRMIP
jgi:predicted RNA-binding Zn-ribbon protein involved in translation (DUF1610 family)